MLQKQNIGEARIEGFEAEAEWRPHGTVSLFGHVNTTGGELTSGRPDWKEGLYLGSELADDHPLVLARTPLHGRNLFPSVPGLRDAVLEYLQALTRLGHALMEGIALSLGLEARYFAERYTGDPLILFRIFNSPTRKAPAEKDVQWGVGEHSPKEKGVI